MLKQEITYVDPWSKEEITEDFYFHFTEAELARMSTARSSLRDEITRISNGDATNREILAMFEMIISKAYGERSDQGRFVKNQEITDSFLSSEPYSALILSFFGSAEAAKKGADFMNGLMPESLLARIAEDEKNKPSDKPSAEATEALRQRLQAKSTEVVDAEIIEE